MALFDRNDNDRGPRGMGDSRGYDEGDYRGMNRPRGNRSLEREGLWANSFSDGAWTADAADRTERDWHLGHSGARGRYDRDIRPAQAGWRAGGMPGGPGMNRGGMDRDREWGHSRGSGDRGYTAGGMDRDLDRGTGRPGGFLDRAQNAVRRGWDRVEERFDRDDSDRGMHMGGGSMRGGTSWAGDYGMRGDSGVRGYRDDEGHYGVAPADGMGRGYGATGYPSSGMSRYGADYDRGLMDRDSLDADRGYRGRQQIDHGDPYGDRQSRTPIRVVEGNRGRYDQGFRGGRTWF